ncbi:hypothetical protein B9G98_02978 [Wickerhamiella sorbophila]|uniref:Subtelomeric hrmA-associated cluster protein AFUB-079030/YDR124W-like helical bundle domain-containing protein n=1 Tax=Wickerhamiella sorbophila TaxID=45607 RepID=A0A2T0FK52_9ASCO|nr:hypothetical protein B9G98_02978 [Wickerhamiella sorbophila]PRT55358.1 hypothetical protein B9G98_02978 [Wickerhamiella sorbophila]
MDPQLFRILDEYALRNEGEYCVTIRDSYGQAAIYHFGMSRVVSAIHHTMPNAVVFPPVHNPPTQNSRLIVDGSFPGYETPSTPSTTLTPVPRAPAALYTPPSTTRKRTLEKAFSLPPKRLAIPPQVKPAQPEPEKEEEAISVLSSLFLELNQLIARELAREWVKIKEPGKKTTFPYSGGDETKPAWWPKPVRHIGPHHLLRNERSQLLATLFVMLRGKQRELKAAIDRIDNGRNAALFASMFETLDRYLPPDDGGLHDQTVIDPSLLSILPRNRG